MKRLSFLVGVAVSFVVFAGCGSSGGSSGTGGKGTGGAGSGGSGFGTGGAGTDGGPSDTVAGSGGAIDASAIGGASQGGAGGGAGTGAAGGSAAPTLAQLCAPAAGAGGIGAASGLAFVNQTYDGDNRVVPSEAIFSFINTFDDPHLQTLRLHNSGQNPVQITSLQIVDNTLAPGANASATPGAAGGTLFPLTYNQVSIPAAFKITPSVAIPTTLAAGADLDVSVQFLSTRTMPPDRMLNIGGQAVSVVLVAQTAGGCVPAGLYGLSLWNNSETPPGMVGGSLPSNNWARYEPTFGQIVATLGYKINLGSTFIQLLNTNDMSIPNIGFSTEEVQVHRFVRANAAAPVQLYTVGRFSPPTDIPFGWYAVGSLTGTSVATGGSGAGGGAGGTGGAGGASGVAGSGGSAGATAPPPIVTDAQPAAIPVTSTQAATQPAPLNVIAAMLSSPLGVDWNTSNYSELVLPPYKTGSTSTTFDPGTAAFGIWAFTNQRTTGGLTSAGVPAPSVGNGDYIYSEDSLNIDATHNHRVRVYPLKNRAGALVPNSFLLGWEEASNGDYQDYVFILKNVSPAP
jgi:hypothetical protein